MIRFDPLSVLNTFECLVVCVCVCVCRIVALCTSHVSSKKKQQGCKGRPPLCHLTSGERSGVIVVSVDVADPLRRWFSTNTRTLDFPATQSETSAGMSYKGAKSTTFNGIECLPWGEVFSKCTKGFEEQNRNYIAGMRGVDYGKLSVSSYLSHMSPDRLGVRDKVIPSGLFDSEIDATRGHNECRMPSFREAWLKSHIRSQIGGGLGYLPAALATTGPFCFVNASDPRAVNYTNATG